MYNELSKQDKKIAKILIDKGVDAEFNAALKQTAAILAEWQSGHLDNRAAYHKVFKKIDECDGNISRRYDGLTGSRYLLTVAAIYRDGQITENDVKDFSDETKAVLNQWLKISKK